MFERKRSMKMLATILWTGYLGLLGTVTIGYLIKRKFKTTLAKIDFVFSIITWIGLFGYVTNTQILTPNVWKIVFFGGLAWDFIYGMFLNDHYGEEIREDVPKHIMKIITAVMFVILLGPLYYGLYRYAF
jgi:hypothetical protein